jgi:putative endonuclease
MGAAVAIPDLWRKVLGYSGERAAERFLKRRGHRILARNFRCPGGEIDLITLDGRTLVFVEVKTRSSCDRVDPEQSVGLNKRRHIILAARYYCRMKSAAGRPCRFDVVAVVDASGSRREIRHIPDAFGCG